MTIRAFEANDEAELRKIHQKFFANQFSFFEFCRGYFCRFTVLDSDNQIIVSGGVRPIVEMVAISNLDLPVKDRRAGYLELLSACKSIAAQTGARGLHAFVQDDKWERVIKRFGFRETKGKAFCVELEN
jgi:hypothetical protein